MVTTPERQSQTTSHGKKPNPYGFLLLIAFILGIIMVLKWSEVVRKKANRKYTLTDKRIEETLKELDKTEKCEVYYLTARSNAWFMCYLCNNGSYYLYAREIWKIGMTCSPDKRYKHEWLQQMNLWYEPVFKGDMKACREEEIKRIAKFPLSAQNMRRKEKDRLVVPPGHGTTKLK